MKDKTEKFIEKAHKAHGNDYDYSKVDYVNSSTKVCIICHKHGEFWQTPSAHLRNKCPECAKEKKSENRRFSMNDLIKSFRKLYGDAYEYSKVEYHNIYTDILVTCPIHGDFSVKPYLFLKGHHGCPMCNPKNERTTESIIEQFRKVHGDRYDYSMVENQPHIRDKVAIICKKHGTFNQSIDRHISGQGCPFCDKENKKNRLKKPPITFEKFLERANQIHDSKYTYIKDIINSHSKIEINCPKHGVFIQNVYDHLNGHGCPKCGFNISKAEDEIYEEITNIIGNRNVIRHERTILDGMELDLYIPEHKIAIEYNGLLWHSEKFGKDRNYHLIKLNKCNEKGIKLIQIFEDEYKNHKEIVIEKLNYIFKNKDKFTKIFARKCHVEEISKSLAKDFLDTNHIQGYVPSSIYTGCFYKGDLIAVMSFRLNDKENNCWELNRFSTKLWTSCCGVASKMFRYFIGTYRPKEVKSFADRRWTTDSYDNLYTSLGFDLVSVLKPDYRYYYNNKFERIHKFNFRKQILHKKFGLSLTMTESEMCKAIGAYKIWDCGLFKFVWT